MAAAPEDLAERSPRATRTRSNRAASSHRTPEERAAAGRAARKQVPRSSHAAFEPAPDRPDPIALLEEQATTRVPELVPIRHGRMLASPFAFFRGAALVMAADLATTPRTGMTAQICGDAHLSNFGLFASPERHLVFDVNDFDETLPGPWEWDVKRLAASLMVAGRHREFADDVNRQAATAAGFGYRTEMRTLAGMGNLDVWYRHVDAAELLVQAAPRLRTMSRRAHKAVDKARSRDSMQALGKLTRVVDGQLRIVSDPPLVVPVEELIPGAEAEALVAVLREMTRDYARTLRPDLRHLLSQFRLVHVARKVVGVGSVGTRAWIGLYVGRDGDDPLFLQAKEAEASVLERFVGRSAHANHGARVVAGQYLMQAASDIFLGWQRSTDIEGQSRDFYFRQLRDWKGSADPEVMPEPGLALYGQLCGVTLARAHARSGDRIAIAAYLGGGDVFDRAIADFAEAYADQNERDYQALRQAVKSGRIEARTGL